jgi:hypothetical protein
MVKFSSIEYIRMKTSVDDKMAELKDTNKDHIPEFEELELISKKLEKKIEETKSKELEIETDKENKGRQKKLWECTNCQKEVTISMVKKCNVCQMAGENIRELLLV